MTLGLRSGSYGSLQNDGLYNNAGSLPTRKVSKVALSVQRDKERILPFICRHTCRGKVVVLLSSVLALFILTYGSFRVNKGQDLHTSASSSFQVYRPPSVHPCHNFAFPPPPPDPRRPGPRPCPVCYLPVEQAIASMPSSPLVSPVIRDLVYVHDENPTKTKQYGGSEFGGYPSLKQRSDSFITKKFMTVHCGFVKGNEPGRQTGFDIDEADLMELNQFHDVIVASAIFGNYDTIHQPENISATTLAKVPFFMFIDEQTEAYMKNSSVLNNSNSVGKWRVIVVKNLPYADSRRNGKIPKLLLHRLFPNVRYSIWIDGKLQLVRDPYQVLERFLWRENATFAISRHYSRFDVFEEAEANKAARKYDNASIDYQMQFYRDEGLTPYSEAKLPITSDVPEGCVLLRAHDHLTNLASCTWFNEVDRFTPRDQLSFSTVRDKILEFKRAMHMFLDCERRNFVIQGYHRGVIPRAKNHRTPPAMPMLVDKMAVIKPAIMKPAKNAAKKTSKRGKGGKKPGLKHNRKLGLGNRTKKKGIKG